MEPFPSYLTAVRPKRDAAPGFDRYPFAIAAARQVDRLALHPTVTFPIVVNGPGKVGG